MSTKNLLHSETLASTWTFRGTYGALDQKLIVAGDRLIGVAGSTLFAVDMHTGRSVGTSDAAPKQMWPYNLTFGGGDPQVTAADGTVYFMNAGKLVARRVADGSLLPGWQSPELRQVIHLFARSGRLVAVHIDPQKGETLVSGFDTITGNRAFGPLPIAKQRPGRAAYGDNALFFVTAGKLNAVNVDFGDTRWQVSVPNDRLSATATPLVAGGVVVMPGSSLYGFDVVTGNKKWSVPATRTGATWNTAATFLPVPAVAATMAANQRALLPTDTQPNPGATAAAASAAGIVVATNSVGDVMGISLFNGTVLWSKKGTTPGAPIIIDNTVFVITDNRTRLARYDLFSGASRGTPYVLPIPAADQQPTIGNGAIYLVDDIGNISEHSFSTQSAAYFDGRGSQIDIKAKNAQFDFGTEDFTVEAWIRGSSGGEIVSVYPKDVSGHGFRFNIAPNGQLRFAVTRSNGGVLNYGRTNSTSVADGEWHHVALVRRDGEFIILLDGRSVPVLLPPTDPGTVSIGGSCNMTIGAFMSAENGRATGHFCGLIREVRIWDKALDAPAVSNNLTVALVGTEPRLRGLWRLDEVQRPSGPVEPRNAARQYPSTAQFQNPASRPTDLMMDRSAFPYLLHESQTQWPYMGTWAARGASAVEGSAAVSADGVVAFSTNNAIYAVRAHDGKRVWSMDVSQTSAGPIADGNGFLVLTEEDSVIRIDSRSGAKTQLPGFDKMSHRRGENLVPPASYAEHQAAATTDGRVFVMKRGDTTAKSLNVGGPTTGLALGSAGLLVLSGTSTARKLNMVDPNTATLRGMVVLQDDVFCMADNWVFCVRNGAVVRLDSADFRLDAAAAISATIPGRITGVVASGNEDLLVVVTDRGQVYGLTLAQLGTIWQTTLPTGPAGGSNAVNPPTFDDDHRIVCTTRSGTFAVLDPETGRLNGLYFADYGAVGTPVVTAGTLFTGCDDAPNETASADRTVDGALHSLVFGETMALRLNLDAKGAPVPNGTQHALIDANTEDCTLDLMGVHESCVEAWVNIPVLSGPDAARAGGGIVGICPARNSGFDINLWIEPDGTLHYTSRAKEEDGTWSGLHAVAATTIIDGKWHHIAVARMLPPASAPVGSPDRVLLYIDGQIVGTTVGSPPAAPLASAIGLKAFIGAVASDNLTAIRPFVGMIAEVRVWDTYMAPSEILSRMHVKLRGDEPALLAYWNFDYEAVHDCARQGHDGALVHPQTHPNWWLTDLPFTQPAYPYVTTSAKIIAQSAGKPTTYELILKVCRADGTGMSGQKVNLWYLKHVQSDPASIIVNATTIQGLKSSVDAGTGQSGSGRFYAGTTASDGTLKLTVITSLHGHGPALDLWTEFMPTNERSHVNVLIDDQTLSKPAPPTLTAQAKLIQDYHYTTGNKVDHTRDRSTWRVVLRAADSKNIPCPREPISIWADSGTTIEVGGKSYQINQHNSVDLTAETNGEMTIVMAADELVAPKLYARAGFMHRNDRIVISPDQDTHTALSTMETEDLTKERVTNWKKDAGPGDKQSLLSKDQHDHASKIAEAVRHVTSSVQQSEPDKPLMAAGRTSPARRKLVRLRAGAGTPELEGLLRNDTIPHDALLHDDMKQPDAAPANDQVVLMRTMAGIQREAPVDTEAFRDSLGGSLGFVFEKKGKNLRYEMLTTQEQVNRERGRATVMAARPLTLEAQLLGSFWDDLVDFATDVYNGATKIVLTIAEQVEVAIHKMVDGIKSVVHTVVSTVEDALNAVAAFFDQLMVGIQKLIEFLRVLFDWQAILRTHDILHSAFLAAMEIATHSLRNTKPLTDAIASLARRPRTPTTSTMGSFNTMAEEAGEDDSQVQSQANSVQGKSMMQRASSTPARSAPAGQNSQAPRVQSESSSMDLFTRTIPALASDLLDMSPSDLITRLEEIILEAISQGLVVAGQALTAIMGKLADSIDWVVRILDAKIDIPFISELYKWITGSDLTLLDVLCLVLAIPMNIAYAFVTLLIKGEARYFADDVGDLAGRMRAAAGLPRAPRGAVSPVPAEAPPVGADTPSGVLLGSETVPGTPHPPEIAFMVFRTMMLSVDVAADGFFITNYVERPGPDPITEKGNGFFECCQGVFGIIAISLQTWESQVNFVKRLRAVAGDKANDFIPPYPEIGYVSFGVLTVLRAKKLYSGGKKMLDIDPTESWYDAYIDDFEYNVTMIVSRVTIILIMLQTIDTIKRYDELKKFGNETVAQEFLLFSIRDLFGLSGAIFEHMFTKRGVREMRNAYPTSITGLYQLAVAYRDLTGVIAIVLHGVAVFQYGDD